MKHIKDLIKNKQYKKTLEELSKIPESSQDFYEALKMKAEVLLASKNWLEALSLTQEELKMPYIPKGYESFFEEVQKIALSHLREKKVVSFILEADFEKALFRDTNTTRANKMLIDIRDLNINKYINIIKKYLEWESGDDILKSTILFLLKENNINKNFKVIKDNKEFFVVPIQIQNTNESESFKYGIDIIENNFFQEISKATLAKKMYFTKLYKQTPYILTKEEANKVAINIVEKVEKLFT